MSVRVGSDTGHFLENLVYLELRRRGGEIDYCVTEAGFEVDFLVQTTRRDERLIRICADLSEKSTRERELRALEDAMREWGLSAASIVTVHDDDETRTAAGSVRVTPAWRWLVESRE